MVEKIKKTILNEINRYEEKKKHTDERLSFLTSLKNEAIKTQEEIINYSKCPICEHEEFWNNLHPYGIGYAGGYIKPVFMEENVRYSTERPKNKNEATTHGMAGNTGRIKIVYRVCKKCGFISQHIDMKTLGDYSFE